MRAEYMLRRASFGFFLFDFYGKKKSNNNSWQNGGMW
jgi:hypothetical protein